MNIYLPQKMTTKGNGHSLGVLLVLAVLVLVCISIEISSKGCPAPFFTCNLPKGGGGCNYGSSTRLLYKNLSEARSNRHAQRTPAQIAERNQWAERMGAELTRLSLKGAADPAASDLRLRSLPEERYARALIQKNQREGYESPRPSPPTPSRWLSTIQE